MINDQHLEGVNEVPPHRLRRVRAAASVPREFVRIAYRDPDHVCERMTLYACQRLAAPARDWAQRTKEAHPEADLRELAAGLGVQSARIARMEGAVAGTPFYVALIPGYLNYLWQELRMTLRLAALYGRDPATLTTAAEALWLRGVCPSIQSAEAGLVAMQATGLPPKPQRRRSPRVWIPQRPPPPGLRRLPLPTQRPPSRWATVVVA